ncbi:MAG: C4-dicarboxylate ABC transporter substrate-binding protein [Rhizobacter sp.]|nr:C4-dicarboxylate ABC transporter substrate-binding protein [Rhizobacter sp.]
MALSPRLRAVAAALSTALERATSATAWLALPLAALLFAQWPLRDLVGAWSREANDAAQWIFALYVALAMPAATRARAHVAAGVVHDLTPWRRRLGRIGEAACVLPWALFVLFAAAAPTWQSVASFERFPDTFNPLYFVVRASAWLLALGVALQALLELFAAHAHDGTQPGATR